MSEETTPVNIGALSIDCTAMASFLMDLQPGATMGMRSQQDGLEEVVNEILSNQPTMGERAGVTNLDTEVILTANQRIAMIDAKLPAARKLVEILMESRAFYDNQRNRQISAIATSVEGRARSLGAPELLARYEKARTYRSAIAMKAARTRRKNMAAELEQSAALEPSATPIAARVNGTAEA